MENLRYLLNICAFLFQLWILIYSYDILKFIWCKIFKKKYTHNSFYEGKDNKVIIISVIILLVGCFHTVMLLFFRNTQIGSLYEKTEYKEKYYINFFYDENDVKNYRIPADIYSFINENEDDENNVQQERKYELLKLYWPNGNVMVFENQEIEPNVKKLVTYKDKNYYIELTTSKIKD